MSKKVRKNVEDQKKKLKIKDVKKEA